MEIDEDTTCPNCSQATLEKMGRKQYQCPNCGQQYKGE